MKTYSHSTQNALRARGEAPFFIILGACAYSAGFANPFFHVPLLILLAPAALFLLVFKAHTRREALLHCWLLATFGFSPSLYWLIYPIHDVGQLPVVLAIPCILLLAGYLALFVCLAALGLFTLRQQLFSRPEHAQQLWRFMLASFAFGLLYAGFEVLSSFLFSGFPWLNLATAFAPWTTWVQFASVIGSFALSAVFVTAAACMAAAGEIPGRKKVLALAVGFSLLLLLPLYGHYRLQTAPPQQGHQFTVGMVQGNIDQNQKWQHENIERTVAGYLNLSQTLLEEQRTKHPDQPVDLILWPETAMPFVFSLQADFAASLRRFALTENVWLGFGTLGYIPQSKAAPEALLNRLQLLSPQGENAGFYDKVHLVPFGEYIPFFLSFDFLNNILQGINFVSGTVTQPLQIAPVKSSQQQIKEKLLPPDKNIALGALICYEVIFPQLATKRVADGANVLLTISNDAWFGPSSAPWQHLHLATMRSIEQFRPMVRATNTGLTAIIDRYGRITTAGTLFQKDTQVVSVSPETRTTLFHHAGFFIEYFLLACALISLLFNIRAFFFRKTT